MRSYQVDMCNGPIFKKLIIFSLPLILSGCLQLLFNVSIPRTQSHTVQH